MEKIEITLIPEEIEGLNTGRSVGVYEDDNKEIIIRIPQTKRECLRQNILDRYDNEEY